MKKVQELHIPQQYTCIVNIFEVVDFLIKNESYSIVCIVASYGDDSYCRLVGKMSYIIVHITP
jgi:hypothetical protein